MSKEYKSLQEIFDEIENLGWKVDFEGNNVYRLSKYSPAGQDFSISVEGENVDEIIDGILYQYELYDVSEQTYLWLDETGHGKNGAPYEMQDVLNDMKACEQYISDLHDELTS